MMQNNGKDDEKNVQWTSILQLLSNQQEVEEIRKQRDKFAQRVLERQQMMKKLVVIGLSPEAVQSQAGIKIERQHVHNCMELLGTLTYHHLELLFTEGNNFLPEVFKLFTCSKPIHETSLAYSTRLLLPFTYHHQKQMVRFLLQHGQPVLHHLYSSSIYEWFLNLLESQDGQQLQEKVELLTLWRTVMKVEEKQDILADMMENYACLMEWLGEGLEGRNLDLAQAVLQDPTALQFCVPSLTNRCSPLHPLSVRVAEACANLCLTHSTLSLHPDHRQLLSQCSLHTPFHTSAISLFYQLRFFYTTLKLTPQHISTQLTCQTLEYLFSLFHSHPNSNIIHNLVKEIVLYSLEESTEVCNMLLRGEGTFVQMMKSMMVGNSSNQYQNQLYHIMKGLLKKEKGRIDEVFEGYGMGECVKVVREKEKFYGKVMGGGVRKDSSGWGFSSGEIILDQLLIKSKSSEQDELIQGGNKHYFDCGLPLDSDESKDQSSGNIQQKSINISQDFLTKAQPILNEEQSPSKAHDLSEQLYNPKHFPIYLSFSLDELQEEIN